ncbi:MAG: aminoglycoside phosphotransferase [Nocardioidaceae bacterium]|nr:aminoglycoside phosphotransferase [Nocardioidaceae bacterium]
MNADLHEHLTSYLTNQRWFGGKGREFSVVAVHPLPWLPSDEVRARIEIVTVAYDDGEHDSYQVPLAYLDEVDPTLVHALVGAVESPDLGEVVAYDAVHLKSVTAALLVGFRGVEEETRRRDEAATRRLGGDVTGDGRGQTKLPPGGLDEATQPRFVVVDGAELPEASDVGTVSSADQSNTSVIYGESAILKLFRRISTGSNPDIEIHEALTRHQSDHIAALLGWIEAQWVDQAGVAQVGQLAMLQAFLRTATDGWHLALTSMRDLLIEADLHPDEVGGDFAAEAERLGAVTADIHLDLASVFDTATLAADDQRDRAAGMVRRLDTAVTAVSELAVYADALRAHFDALASLDQSLRVQRIHGDLHLGQALRTVNGWKLIDFEGEPLRPLADRVTLDSPWRDVAGMVRSFDYAAGATLHQFGENVQLSYRADEWAQRNRTAFLSGYTSVAGEGGSAEQIALRAYETDKAVYEVVYESRNRPTWVAIPLAAVARLAAQED